MSTLKTRKRLKDKKILVTGGTGFLGSYLVPELKKNFHNVSLFNGDVRKIDALSEPFDIVFHLAAIVKPTSPQLQEELVDVACGGALAVAKYCKKNNAKCFFSSSAAVYMPTSDNARVTEGSSIHPQGVNGAGKYLSELIFKYYSNAFSIPTIVLRIFNLYGAGQNDSFLIPYLSHSIHEERSIYLNAPSAIRDFIHVTDVVDIFIKLINADLSEYEILNIGTGQGHSVFEVSEIISRLLGKKIKIKSPLFPHKTSVVANTSKIFHKIQWHPKVTLSDGIKKYLYTVKLSPEIKSKGSELIDKRL
jgi:nucleoside-diphosphate-sugar epimerase